MTLKRFTFLAPAFLAALACLATTSAVDAAGWGSVKGKFVIEGDAPKPILQIKKGDAAVKDSAVCAAGSLNRNDLVIDQKTGGIQHIFIFLRKVSEGDIHPDLKTAKLPELKQDQKGCRFLPHTMFVRTGQDVRIISNDPVAHNTHGTFFKNPPFNQTVAASDNKVGLVKSFKLSESLPMPVVCDIHPHLKAHWLILNHPYAAITNEKGEFEIKNLPEGDHKFRVWHEKAGYIERSWKVSIKDGKVTDMKSYEVAPKDFKD